MLKYPKAVYERLHMTPKLLVVCRRDHVPMSLRGLWCPPFAFIRLVTVSRRIFPFWRGLTVLPLVTKPVDADPRPAD
jgi:hypothetical protein